MEPHYYAVTVNWSNDRIGRMSSPELDTTIDVATPPQFPKGVAGVWSPEHLLTAAVASCLMTTFLSIAENSKLSFTHFSCQSSGKLEQIEGKLMMSEITLNPTIIISLEADREKAERVLQKSEAACLISNSVKANIHMVTNIQIA